jgi:hypothetical protein
MRKTFAYLCAAAIGFTFMNRYYELWTTGRQSIVLVSAIMWTILGGLCVRIYKYEQ